MSFAARLGPSSEAIGMAELQPRPAGAANISYAIRPAWRRQGYGARAVRLLSTAGLKRFGFQRIELRCDVDNAASARTAERAGFIFEGIAPGTAVYEEVPEWRESPRDERVCAVRHDR
jgi:RimJ/RimL family protein N-acetyltransferase